MTTLVTVMDQDNLISINRMQFHSVREKMEKNYFLNLTRNTRLHGDSSGNFYKDGQRYMLLSHFDSVKPEGGLRVAYKVDKELWEVFSTCFPKEAA